MGRPLLGESPASSFGRLGYSVRFVARLRDYFVRERPIIAYDSSMTGTCGAILSHSPANRDSVAFLHITKEAMVAEKPKTETAPAMPLSSMGGMDY